MTRMQRRPFQLSTEKKWEAATSRSTKRGPRASAFGAAMTADAAVLVAADSRMRITANRLASRANRVGNVQLLMMLAWPRTFEETHEHHVQKAPEGNETAGKATG